MSLEVHNNFRHSEMPYPAGKENVTPVADAGRKVLSRGRSREAEDILANRVKPRNLSLPPTLKEVKDADDVYRKSGVLWDCVERKPNKLGGDIYIFKLKPEFDDISGPENQNTKRFLAAAEALRNAYPASESIGSSLGQLDPKSDFKNPPDIEWEQHWELYEKSIYGLKDYKSKKEALKAEQREIFLRQYEEEGKVLQRLGYIRRCTNDGVYLEMPDRDALVANWNELREENKNLPELDVLYSDGIATDNDYVEAFLTHDILISKSNEFLHDSHVHAIRTIRSIISTTNYSSKRAKVVEDVAKSYRSVVTAKQELKENNLGLSNEQRSLIERGLPLIEATLGAYVDSFSADGDYNINSPELFNGRHIFMVHQNPLWQKYFTNRFPGLDTNDSEARELIQNAWELMTDLSKRVSSR